MKMMTMETKRRMMTSMKMNMEMKRTTKISMKKRKRTLNKMSQNEQANHRDLVESQVQVKINQDSLLADREVVLDQEANQDQHQEARANQEEDKVLQVVDRVQEEVEVHQD